MENWIKNHYGLLMALGSGIVIGILGAYADTNKERADYYNRQAEKLADGLTIARQELYACPEAAELIDKSVNERHPNENNAGIVQALRYISKSAGVKVMDIGDDWEPAKNHVVNHPKRIVIPKE